MVWMKNTIIYSELMGRKLVSMMIHDFHINTKEFIAATIGLWLELFATEDEHTKIHCLTDNSSAIWWLFKANFNPDTQQKHDMIARKMASILLHHEAALYPQHIPGESNTIADSLSRDFHFTNKQLQFLLPSLFPTQAPKTLSILQELPREIISRVESLRDYKTKTLESPLVPAPSKMGALVAGNDSWSALVYKTNVWIHSAKSPESAS